MTTTLAERASTALTAYVEREQAAQAAAAQAQAQAVAAELEAEQAFHLELCGALPTELHPFVAPIKSSALERSGKTGQLALITIPAVGSFRAYLRHEKNAWRLVEYRIDVYVLYDGYFDPLNDQEPIPAAVDAKGYITALTLDDALALALRQHQRQAELEKQAEAINAAYQQQYNAYLVEKAADADRRAWERQNCPPSETNEQKIIRLWTELLAALTA